METIGDCYLVAGGLVAYDRDGYKSVLEGAEDPLHAVRVMEFAKVGRRGGAVPGREGAVDGTNLSKAMLGPAVRVMEFAKVGSRGVRRRSRQVGSG